jgi:hypothetical protein
MQWLVGGSITQADIRSFLMKLLKSSVTPGAAPRSSQVGETKALEIFSRLEASQNVDPPPPLTPKAAQSFSKLLKRSESLEIRQAVSTFRGRSNGATDTRQVLVSSLF